MRPPLISAVKVGNHQIVSQLLSEGANVNETDKYGRSALELASLTRNHRLLIELLRAGAKVNDGVDLNASSLPQDKHPLMFAMLFQHPTLRTANTPLIFAMTRLPPESKISAIQLLLNAGADPNLFNEVDKSRPLKYAIDMQPPELRVPAIQILLNAGADPNAVIFIDRSNIRCNALMAAGVNTTPLLLNHSNDVSVNNAMALAQQQSNLPKVTLLQTALRWSNDRRSWLTAVLFAGWHTGRNTPPARYNGSEQTHAAEGVVSGGDRFGDYPLPAPGSFAGAGGPGGGPRTPRGVTETIPEAPATAATPAPTPTEAGAAVHPTPQQDRLAMQKQTTCFGRCAIL